MRLKLATTRHSTTEPLHFSFGDNNVIIFFRFKMIMYMYVFIQDNALHIYFSDLR